MSTGTDHATTVHDDDPLDRDFSEDIAAGRFESMTLDDLIHRWHLDDARAEGLMTRVGTAAAAEGVSTRHFIRRALEEDLRRRAPASDPPAG